MAGDVLEVAGGPGGLPPRLALEGSALLDDVEAALWRFVSWPSDHAGVVAALWCAHAHAAAASFTSPRIALLSAEPASGKSRALEILAALCPRTVLSFNATAAYIARKISDDSGLPTLLIDEADTIFHPKAGPEAEAVRAILNAGYRRGATAGRCIVIGKRVETEELPAFCPVALAGLGELPGSLASRAIVIAMRPPRPDEARPAPFRPRDDEPALHALRDRLAAWAAAAESLLEDARPALPSAIVDRDADKWDPLLAIADLASGGWPERARAAATHFVEAGGTRPQSIGLRLLGDIRRAFGGDSALTSTELIERLKADPEAPWGDLGHGRALDARRLAKLLEPYGCRPGQLWQAGRNARGFRRADFADAWARYLPPEPAE